MAHFRGTVQGSKGQASRLGGRPSGLRVTASGWNIGADVVMSHIDGKDVVRVYKTTGSSAVGKRELIAEYSES